MTSGERASDNFHISLSLQTKTSAITNIIFAYPQPVLLVPPGVRVPQVGNHWVKTYHVLLSRLACDKLETVNGH
jgi:hypothetical protein